MADIMMCNADCPFAYTCRRSPESGTPVSTHWQSWWMREASDPVGDDCPSYWPKETERD